MKSWWQALLALLALSIFASSIVIALHLSALEREAEEAWATTESALKAKNENLALEAAIPAPIPDSNNFFSDPLWTELSSDLPKEQHQLEGLHLPLSSDERATLKKEFPTFPMPKEKTSRIQVALNLAQFAAKLPQVERSQAATRVLALLAESAPMIDQLNTLTQRKGAVFPVKYADGVHMKLGHVMHLLAVGQWLNAHALASWEQGDPSTAGQDALTLLRLSHVLDAEPILISKLVQGKLVEMALGLIDPGIKEHVWDQAQLNGFAQALAGIRLLPQLADALRLERASLLVSAPAALDSDDDLAISKLSGMSESSISKNSSMSKPSRWFYKQFLWPKDKALFCNVLQGWIDAVTTDPGHRITEAQVPDPVTFIGTDPKEMARTLFSSLALPSVHGAVPRIAFIQTKLEQTRLACALELQYLATGSYPDSLTNLPQTTYTEDLARDGLLEAVRYTKTTPSTFTLWSPGWDGKDDGGKIAKNPTEGDWIWAGHAP